LDDQGVDPRLSHEAKEPLGLGEFRGEDKNIHGEVTAAPPRVEVVHHFGEILLGKVFRPETGVEGGQAEIDRISSGGYGGLETVPISGGGEQLRSWIHCQSIARKLKGGLRDLGLNHAHKVGKSGFLSG
jgi:hypothetical protein